MVSERDHALTVRLSSEMVEELRACAEREERSISSVIRVACRRLLAAERDA